jgi:hypothetical protein
MESVMGDFRGAKSGEQSVMKHPFRRRVFTWGNKNTERPMKLAIIMSAVIAMVLPQLALAGTPKHNTSASRSSPAETIDGHKIPGAPNGMLAELMQSTRSS